MRVLITINNLMCFLKSSLKGITVRNKDIICCVVKEDNLKDVLIQTYFIYSDGSKMYKKCSTSDMAFTVTQ